MKPKSKKRHSININSESFETIKKHCDKNALDLPKWLVKIAIDNINNKQKE